MIVFIDPSYRFPCFQSGKKVFGFLLKVRARVNTQTEVMTPSGNINYRILLKVEQQETLSGLRRGFVKMGEMGMGKTS